MIKKILPISVFVLVLILIVLFGIQNMLSKNSSQGTSNIAPTMFQTRQGLGGSYNPQTGKTSPQSAKQLSPEELQKRLPIVASDFTLDYSPRMQKYVVSLKTDGGQVAYNQWLDQNSSFIPLLPPEQVVVAHQSVVELNAALDYADKNKLSPEQEFKKNTDTLLNIANTLFSPMSLPQETISVPTLTPIPFPTEKAQTNSGNSDFGSGNYTYYSQCGGTFDAMPLPNGCTICKAGCGPTSVAMILSTYIDKSLTPPKTIDLMAKTGVSMGCNGSGIYEIYSYLRGRGDLEVTDFIIPSEGKLSAKEVEKDFRGYTKSGWTIFVLANFKTNGGGHYFWVTDVSDQGDILAYDPYYGRQQTPPIDENRYAPAPYYRYAFAVKKG